MHLVHWIKSINVRCTKTPELMNGATAAVVSASFRFQEFRVIIWFWRCEVSYENGQLKWKHHFLSHSLRTLLLKLSQPKMVADLLIAPFDLAHNSCHKMRVFNNWVPAPAECWHNYAPLKLHLLSWKTHHSRFSNIVQWWSFMETACQLQPDQTLRLFVKSVACETIY